MRNPHTNRRLRPPKRAPKLTPKRALQAAVLLALWTLWSLFAPDTDTRSGKSAEVFDDIPAKESAESGKVRICTWNVRNYSVAGRRVDGKYIQAPKPEAEKAALRRALVAINADVVLIDEMGDIEFLKELRNDLAKDGLVYNYISTTRYDSSSRLAILSRIKPERFVDCCDIKFPFRGDNRYSPRGTLGASFETLGTKWHAFAVHLKSPQGARKSDENFMPFRFAELRAIDARIVSEIGKRQNVIMAGDFNQEPSQALLRNLKNLKLGLLEQSDSAGMPHTYIWKKKNAAFRYDFFLVSPQMAEFVAGKAVIFRGIDGASDHYPVYVDLDFSKAKTN